MLEGFFFLPSISLSLSRVKASTLKIREVGVALSKKRKQKFLQHRLPSLLSIASVNCSNVSLQRL
jgi:hypothetical protein